MLLYVVDTQFILAWYLSLFCAFESNLFFPIFTKQYVKMANTFEHPAGRHSCATLHLSMHLILMPLSCASNTYLVSSSFLRHCTKFCQKITRPFSTHSQFTNLYFTLWAYYRWWYAWALHTIKKRSVTFTVYCGYFVQFGYPSFYLLSWS